MPSLIDRTWTPPVARRQLGVFTSAQARATGMSRRQIDYRIAIGVWKRIVGRGLVLSEEDVTPRSLGVAAWLTRPGSILLGPAAAAFHGAPIPTLSTVDVWTDRPGDDLGGGIRPRHVRLDRSEVAAVPSLGLPSAFVAARERAFVDALAWLPLDDARDLLAWLASRDFLSRDELRSRLTAQPRARGNAQVRRLLDLTARGAHSHAEGCAHDLLDAAKITGWEADAPVRDVHGRLAGRADVLFAAQRVIIEIDGRRAHADRFQQDRTRDNRLAAAGYLVLRFTYDDIVQRPDETVRTIRAVLSERSTV